jgi:WD40 repeat protein
LNYRHQRNTLEIEQRKTQANLNWALKAERTANERLAQTQEAETKGRERLFESLVSQAQARRVSRRMGQRFKTLEALDQAATIARELKLPPERFDLLRDEAIACLALPDLKPTGRVITCPPWDRRAAFDSTLTRYALRFRGGTIQVRQVADDAEIARFQARCDREKEFVDFSPDGRYLATTHFPGSSLTVWDVDRGSIALNGSGPVHWAAAKFSPDSRRIAVCSGGGELLIYVLSTGQPSCRWRVPAPFKFFGYMAFRGDWAQIALICEEKGKLTCQVFEAESGRRVRSISLPSRGAPIAWSPDGTTLATPYDDQKIYLWDAATGIRQGTLEGHNNGGLRATFHPAGTILASTGWEGRVWFWDPVLGRPWFNLNLIGSIDLAFSRDGRMIVSDKDGLTEYQVDPALEYRTLALAHVFSQQNPYGRPSIRSDGRVLAVGTTEGVLLWDLARGAELGFLPIGHAWHSMFDASGNLLTSGSRGVQRWPVKLDPERGEFRIGPPQQLPLPAKLTKIDADRGGRIVALADYGLAFVATPERTLHVGPLDGCRYVAVSPDGEWLATGSHGGNGAQVWRVRDAT